MSGRVTLLGAGPGNPELLTLIGKRRLGEADVVLYDRLIDPSLLSLSSFVLLLRPVPPYIVSSPLPRDLLESVESLLSRLLLSPVLSSEEPLASLPDLPVLVALALAFLI